MSLLPYLNADNTIIDGSYFHILPFCKARCCTGKCREYYNGLRDWSTGAYSCPYGLSSYVYSTSNEKIIFTGLKIRGIYNKKKAEATRTQEYVYNPVIDVNSCNSIAKEDVDRLLEKHSLEVKLDSIRDLLHEARSLNSHIKNSIDLVWETHSDEEAIDYNTMLETLKNAHVCSFMVSNRFSYFDSILNPTLSKGEPYPAVIFKKFDKMRRLLKGYQRKNVWISISSPSQSSYMYNIYPTFETLLFLLLENAIKYSPEGKSVDVQFDENGHLLDVTIRSLGPYCDENEIMHLCEKGFRGEYAKEAQGVGQGFGLNFAQKICDAHQITLSFQSTYSHKDHGVKYGYFAAKLHFDNTKFT